MKHRHHVMRRWDKQGGEQRRIYCECGWYYSEWTSLRNYDVQQDDYIQHLLEKAGT